MKEGLILSLTPSQTVKVPPPAQTPSTQETPGTEGGARSPATPHRPAAGRGKESEARAEDIKVLVTGERSRI